MDSAALQVESGVKNAPLPGKSRVPPTNTHSGGYACAATLSLVHKYSKKWMKRKGKST
jgi:hypothetical protein